MGFILPTPYFHSINPVLIVVFTGISLLFFKKTNQSPSPVVLLKSFGFLSISVFMLVWSTSTATFLHLPLVFSMILFQTIAELLIVPKTLETLGKSAPVECRQKTMSLWLGCIAAAHILASHLSGLCLDTKNIPGKADFIHFYGVLAGISLLLVAIPAVCLFFKQYKTITREKPLLTHII